MSRLFADVIDRICIGWYTGLRAYGKPHRRSRWAQINGYLFYGAPGDEHPGDEEIAATAIRERWWVREYERWFAEEKPSAIARNLELQSVDPTGLDDDALADHIRDAAAHLLEVGPLHFSHRGRELVNGEVRKAAETEGVSYDLLTLAYAGGSPASSRPAEIVATIAAALRAGGVDPAHVSSLDDVRAVPAAASLLDDYLAEFGLRLLDSYDLAGPTLHERPEVIVASIRAAASGRRHEPAPVELPPMSDQLRVLLDEARISHGTEDDDDGVCIFWPSGLLRRALLELARRRGLGDPAAIFEADVDELHDLLSGDGPSHDELEARLAFRIAAARVKPPEQIGGEQAPAGAGDDDGGDGVLKGTGVGNGVARGRACVVRSLDGDGLAEIEPGDVLIATTTTPGYNAVMPIVAAVATETHMGHTVICARELGLPAVVGVRGLLDAIPHGATVEVDAGSGTVRLVD